jgi:hypothetical protein
MQKLETETSIGWFQPFFKNFRTRSGSDLGCSMTLQKRLDGS